MTPYHTTMEFPPYLMFSDSYAIPKPQAQRIPETRNVTSWRSHSVRNLKYGVRKFRDTTPPPFVLASAAPCLASRERREWFVTGDPNLPTIDSLVLPCSYQRSQARGYRSPTMCQTTNASSVGYSVDTHLGGVNDHLFFQGCSALHPSSLTG